MKAKIVLGLQFGDEGKGITTDYLCSYKCVTDKTINLRFSGGQQAGHTVHKDGKKHVFATFGSGTLAGCPTYLTEHTTFYPSNMLNEWNVLRGLQVSPKLYIHPKAMCTTPFDVAFNRLREQIVDHGTCGIGVGATMKRNLQSPYKFYATDLLYQPLMDEKIKGIRDYYVREIAKYTSGPTHHDAAVKIFLDMAKKEMEHFLHALNSLPMQVFLKHNICTYDKLLGYDWLVFEGSQGILLDMEHGLFPHVTYAHTTSKNAIDVCKELGISRNDIEIFYVTRCYQTRHGTGWMSNSTPITLINNEHETNVHNKWQKDFKIGEIDYKLLNYAMKCDSYSWGCEKNLVVTCQDVGPDM